MQKSLKNVKKEALQAATKFLNPTVSRGKTAFPKTQKDLERLGVRFDYDGKITMNEIEYHKYQMQPNAGKISSSIKEWRENNGGTHAVMESVFVKVGGDQDDLDTAFTEAFARFNDKQ